MMGKQRLEYTDFSAGITENFVPGKPNAYQRADNLLITRDKHLETRPGSQILGTSLYQLPSGTQRVASLIPYHNETNLFAISGGDVFYVNSANAWTTLQGPFGRRAFASNTSFSQTSTAEWRKHLFFVPDGGDGPMMVYPDASGTFQLRQAGLPKPVVSAFLTNAQLLTAAITLAVAARASMLIHYADTGSHVTAHTTAITALTALTTPTDLASFLSYLTILVTQYNLHTADALLDDVSGPQIFHANVQKRATSTFLGRYSVLNSQASTKLAAATTLLTGIAILNDLRNRYNFHTYSTLTHLNAVTSLSTGGYYPATVGTYTTNQTGYGLNAIATPPVVPNTFIFNSVTYFTPVYTAQVGAILTYLNQIKKEYNAHLASNSHDVADTENLITVPDATDAFSAYVLLAHLEFFYWWHYSDAATLETGGSPIASSLNFTGTITNGSAVAASTSIDNSASLLTGRRLSNATFASGPGYWIKLTITPSTTKVTSSTTANQITFDQVLNPGAPYSGTAAVPYRLLTTRYHYGLDLDAGSPTSPTLYQGRVGSYDLTGLDPSALIPLMTAFGIMFKSHELAGWAPVTVNGDIRYFVSHTGQSSSQYTTHFAVDVGSSPGTLWPEATVVIDGVTYSTSQAVSYFATPPKAGSVLYTLIWRYDYSVGTISFENISTPAQHFSVTWSPSPSHAAPLTTALYPITLSGLPVLVNQPGQNWDTSSIVLDIYRTITDGKTFFLAGTVANGVTTFLDNVTDATLISGQTLYTTGGVVANDQPPKAKYLTLLNSTAYYGYVSDVTSGEVFSNRVIQSIPDAPWSAPATFFDDLDDDLMGLTNFNSYVVALCSNSILRLEGTFNELGQGAITHQEISKTTGCVSNKSIVATEQGVFFAGIGGIFWTDAYTIQKITTELDRTYASYTASPTQRQAVFGVYDKLNRRIYWAFRSNGTTPECDVVWVLDLNWGLSEKMSFTTMSGGANFTPTAFAFYQGQLLRGDAGGYCFKYDPTYKSDPLIDPSTAATNWSQQPILWDFISCATNFGSSQMRKWATRVTIQGKNRSNLSLAISAKNDDGKAGFKSLVPLRSRQNARWGDFTIKWNDTANCFWKYDGMIDDFRRFPAGTLRCDWKTVRFTNAFVIIANSDMANAAGYLTGSGD